MWWPTGCIGRHPPLASPARGGRGARHLRPRLSARSPRWSRPGPMRIGELARAEQVEPPTMTRLIDGMERDGYVVRRQIRRTPAPFGSVPPRKAPRAHEGTRERVTGSAAGLRTLSPDELARAWRPALRSCSARSARAPTEIDTFHACSSARSRSGREPSLGGLLVRATIPRERVRDRVLEGTMAQTGATALTRRTDAGPDSRCPTAGARVEVIAHCSRRNASSTQCRSVPAAPTAIRPSGLCPRQRLARPHHAEHVRRPRLQIDPA